MKGQDKVIAILNKLLADELTAINQYMVHSEMHDNWGYVRLHKAQEKIAIDEMKHAEKLIGRIIFLEGAPTVSQLNSINVGKDVPSMNASDVAAESDAVRSYNDAIRQVSELGDSGTREMLEHILADEEKHLDWFEAQRDQIGHMSVATYLTAQIED